MKGTEKQIAWAEDIKANMNKTFDAAKVELNKVGNKDGLNMINKWQEALNKHEYARDIIDCFRNVYFNGNVEHDTKEILSVYKITVPTYTTGKELLCK